MSRFTQNKLIQKKFRLKRPEIEYLLKKGNQLTTDLFIVRFSTQADSDIKNESVKTAHFTVIASARLSKKAVERNRIKRQVYEAIRLNMLESPMKAAIIPKKRALKAPYKEIESNIKQILTWTKKSS